MKNRVISLLLCLLLLLPSTAFAAEITILETGMYVGESGEELGISVMPYQEDDVLYLPVAAVLSQLGVSVEEQNGVLTAQDVTLTADSQLITKGDQRLLAMRPPVLKDGVIYLGATIMQKVFGVVVTRSSKDNSVKIRLGEAAAEVVDDSWYYELVDEEEPSEALSDFEIIRQNLLSRYYMPTGDPTRILSLMRRDGAFTDLEYGPMSLNNSWGPSTHLSRISTLCAIFYCPENPHYRDPEGMDAIARSIDYWVKNDFVASGWWFNDVGVPGEFQKIAMFKPEGVEKHWDYIMKKCAGVVGASNGDSSRPFVLNDPLAATQGTFRSYTGSGSGPPSRIAVSLREMVNSDQTDEEKDQMLKECMEGLSYEIAFLSTRLAYNDTGLEGDTLNIQADYSYHDHANSLHQNSYGTNYLFSAYWIFRYLEGTKYKITDEAARALENQLLDGWRWFNYNNYYLFNSLGRGVADLGYETEPFSIPLSQVNMFCYYADMLLTEYADVIERPSELQEMCAVYANPKGDHFTGNRYFWVSDYMAHSRENYVFNIFTPSTRMKIQESLSTLNLKARYIGDGFYSFLKHGDDNNIPGHLDWNRLAGTTVEQGQVNLSPGVRDNEDTGVNDFVGGVSDGTYGLALFDYEQTGVTATKAWFCFDDEIVCLGAGITGKGKNNVVTTVNQTKLYGEVKAGSGTNGKVLDDPAPKDISGSGWVLHDGIGYVFQGNETLTEEHTFRSAQYREINASATDDVVSEGEVFILGIDHGAKPAGASYDYTMLPETDEAGVAAYSQNPKAVTVSNTEEVQAVWHKDLKILQAAFYKKGSVTTPSGLTVTVSEPCAVMVTFDDEGGYQVHASDPLQGDGKLTVALSGTVSDSITFQFSTGERGHYAGKGMHYDSKDGLKDISFNPNLGENSEFDEAASLWAIAVDGELFSSFHPYHHIYQLTVSEIPEIKAKGNFPCTVETDEDQTVITVTDPSNPDNQAVYVIQYKIINQ